MNKFIFNTVFGLVISIPFMIPGCSPIGDTDLGGAVGNLLGTNQLEGLTGGTSSDSGLGSLSGLLGNAVNGQQTSKALTELQKFVDAANAAASKDKRNTDIYDVMGQLGPASTAGVTLEVNGDTVSASFADLPETCVISFGTGPATASCSTS